MSAAQTLAGAIRRGAERSHERRGPRVYRATITSLDPFGADLHGVDLTLDADDVTYTDTVVKYDADTGLKVGDELALLEVENTDTDVDFLAVAVVPDTEEDDS